MSQRMSVLHALRWDLALLGALAFALGLLHLMREPRVQLASEQRTEGSKPPDRIEGDVLLLLPDSPAAEATSLGELDCSYGWFNSLWQEYGSFATALKRNLSPELLAGRSVVIVPARVARDMPPTGISALERFARAGGQVIVEQPPQGWEGITGLAHNAKTREAQRITSAEGLGLHGPTRKHLPHVPMTGTLQIAPPMPMAPQGPVLLEVDGQPGLITHTVDQGRSLTLLFNFGCVITALQQGTPTRGMTFTREGPPGPLRTADRTADPKLREGKVPYADLLERAIFTPLSEPRPMPRLWPYPGKHAGAMLLIHPTPGNTRAALGYADWARKQQATSTVLVAADRLTPPQRALLDQSGAEIGLLWVRGATRPKAQDLVGLGAIKPLARELSLVDQRERLQDALPEDREVRVVSLEDSQWAPGFSETFGALAAAKLRMDSSFGPAEREDYGFLFGTGYPFYPLDERGLPIPILELPYVLHESSLTLDRLKQFLGNSQADFHQPITVRLSSTAMRQAPGAGILTAIRQAHELARQHNHWITTMGELLDFVSARRQSSLTSQWAPAARRLTISVNLLGTASRTITTGAVPGVSFPRTYRGEEVERVTVDGKEVPLKLIATSGPSLDRIVEVAPGRHTISVYYKNPNALPLTP